MRNMKINIQNFFNEIDYSQTIELVGKQASNLLQLTNKEINLVFISNLQIQEMNKQYRKKDYPTDVLTFPNGENNQLGDVVISLEKCEEQRLELGHSFERELGFLFVHGLLHTLGYDHQTETDEEEMVELQNKVLHKAKLFR